MTDTTTEETTETAVATTGKEARRKLAILKAVGLDKVPEEQREIALAIANRYELDLMLKHLVLVDGRPYLTRDALLHIAHRSGKFDGMEMTEPVIKDFPTLGQCWYAVATVHRTDMSMPFKYPGRYPVAGTNKKYGPEMAIKTAESMALRRAFDVSAPTVEEQWDDDTLPVIEGDAPKSLTETVAAKAAALTPAAEQTAPLTDLPIPEAAPTFGTYTDAEPDRIVGSVPWDAGAIVPEVPEDIGQLPEPLPYGDTGATVAPDTGEIVEPATPDPTPALRRLWGRLAAALPMAARSRAEAGKATLLRLRV